MRRPRGCGARTGRRSRVGTATGKSGGTVMSEPAYEATLKQRFGEGSFTTSQFRDNRRVIVKAGQVYAFLECLKNECGFDMLADVTAVDYLNYPDARDRFGLVYLLLN